MTDLLLAALFLPRSRFLVSSTPLRPALIRVIGEEPWGFCSLLAVGAFAWLIYAYVGAPNVRSLDAAGRRKDQPPRLSTCWQ